MKGLFLFIYIALLASRSFGQVSFEFGYFFDNSGKKTECLIKNADWNSNPNKFQYKLDEASLAQTASIESIKEFGVYDKMKYQRHKIHIDRSSSLTHRMSKVMNPSFNEELLFLKVLVEGKATLFSYKEAILERFFYQVEGREVEQLVYKEYITLDAVVKQNNQYKQQLTRDLKCAGNIMTSIENIAYKKRDLVRLFLDHSTCNQGEPIDLSKRKNTGTIKLSLRPGIGLFSLRAMNDFSTERDFDVQNGFRFRVGVEGAFTLPFNKNKWALLIEPTYQSSSLEEELNGFDVAINYNSIELPIGIKHSFYMSNNSSVFIKGLLVIDISLNSQITFNSTTTLDMASRPKAAIGFGYQQAQKWHAEFRIGIDQEVLGQYVNWNSHHNNFSLIVGYTMF